MAVVRARTSPPYALIIFVILWVISTGLAVFLFTQQSKLKQDADASRAELEKYVLPRERGDAQKLIEAGAKGPAKSSAIAEATRQIKDLKEIIAGDSGRNADVIVNEAKDEKGAHPTVVAALRAEREQVKQLTAQVDSLKNDLKVASDRNESQRLEFVDARKKDNEALDLRKAEVAKLTEDAASLQTKITALNEEREKIKTDYEAKIDALVRKQALEKAELVAKIQALENTVQQLRLIIEGLRPRSGSKIPAVANGKVIRSDSISGDVYINIGRADRVVPGLSFNIYDSRTGVVTDGAGMRGKAAIEVVDVGERESRCRVTHTEKNQSLQPGDLLFNVVWTNDKTRTLHFVVYGDFDIDGDGDATALEREKLVRMIKDWGGKVDDIKFVKETKGDVTQELATLDPQTDYLVLGTSPRVPAGVKPEDLDQASKDVFSAQVAKSKEFDRVESEAKRSSVPILNANRFLNLIGYYNTTLIRH